MSEYTSEMVEIKSLETFGTIRTCLAVVFDRSFLEPLSRAEHSVSFPKMALNN